MKKLFSICLLLSFMIVTTSYLQAQSYKNAIGLRLGLDYGLSFKHFLNETAAVEIYGSTRSYGDIANYSYRYTRIGVLYQIHKSIPSVPGLAWYYGGGIGVTFWSGDLFDNSNYKDEKKLGLGISGNLGLDFKFPNAPINLSVDWVPTFFISGYGNGFGSEVGGLAARFTF